MHYLPSDRFSYWDLSARRKSRGGTPTDFLKATDRYSSCLKPVREAISESERSVPVNSSFTLPIFNRVISSCGVRPRAERKRLSNTRLESGTAFKTSLTLIPDAAFSLMKRNAAATSASSMARISVD